MLIKGKESDDEGETSRQNGHPSVADSASGSDGKSKKSKKKKDKNDKNTTLDDSTTTAATNDKSINGITTELTNGFVDVTWTSAKTATATNGIKSVELTKTKTTTTEKTTSRKATTRTIVARASVADNVPPATAVVNNAALARNTSYSTLRTGIIRLTPEIMKCKLYCKGAACRYCTAGGWPTDQQALDGLYSSWITDRILAMARPTAAHFDDYRLLEQFRANGIETVFNLQCGGEHSFCGPPLTAANGFTYDPEFLMQNKIYYYNYTIPDFEPGTVEMTLNIVKVMHFSLKHGKVAIHCHAGLGRTGTLAACYLVWSTGCLASKAIDTVRRVRPNSIQSPKQINAITHLEKALQQLASSLPRPPISGASSIDDGSAFVQPLSVMLANQRRVLPNEEAQTYSHTPKLMFLVCDRLLKLVFEETGVRYNALVPTAVNDTGRQPAPHNVRACTFGVLCVNWRNAFTHKGRSQVRYIMNLFVRLSAFPYDVDHRLRSEFRRCSLVGSRLVAKIALMNASQLVHLLNVCMESVRRPYCSNVQLIKAMEWFAPRDTADTPPPLASTEPCGCGAAGCSGGNGDSSEEDKANEMGSRTTNATWSRARVPLKIETRTVPRTLRHSASAASGQCTVKDEKRRVHINEEWHCMVFHLLNVLSYLSSENYDVLTDLITYWLTGDAFADVKAAVYCHMSELFARNMHQQDVQAAQYRRQMAATGALSPSSSRLDLLANSVGAISFAPAWNFL